MANEMILIIDADIKSQKVLEVSFKKAGYRVEIVDSIAEAYERIADTPPALIISDTTLPDGDGLELCADLSLDPDTEEIPLIFLTKDRSLTNKMRSFELGADDYLTKPIYIKEVTTRAELLIQRRLKQKLSESDVEEFEGNLRDITMIDLLQTIEEESRSGSLRIHRGGRHAALYFRDGNILDAVCGKLQGEDAVYRIMLWSVGQFVINYHDNIRRADHIERDTSALLMEGMRRLEQWNELITTLPAVDRIFEADYQNLPHLLDELPPEVERLVRLFDGYRKLRDVIDDSPIDDITTLQIIGKLLDDELLVDISETSDDDSPTSKSEQQKASLHAWLGDASAPASDRARPSDEDETSDGDADQTPGAADDAQTTEGSDGAHTQPADDEIDTEELAREADDAPTPEEHREPNAGGGHWKFHWGDDRNSHPRNSSTRTIETHAVNREQRNPEDPPAEQAPQEQPEPETIPDSDSSEKPKESSTSDEKSSLDQGLEALERQELLRREEEARQLSQQKIDAQDEAPSQPSDAPPEPQLRESTDPTDESPRPRRHTPTSSPALVTQMDGESIDTDDDEAPNLTPDYSGASSAAAAQDEIATGRLSISEEIKEIAAVDDDAEAPSDADDDAQESPEREFRDDVQTNKIGIPDEIRELRDKEKAEQSSSENPEAMADTEEFEPIPDTAEQVAAPSIESETATEDAAEDAAEDEDLFDDQSRDDDDLFDDIADDDEFDPDEPIDEPVESLDGSGDDEDLDLHPSFDESNVETTDEFPPPALLTKPQNLVTRNAKNGEIVTTEYNLSKSPSSPVARADDSTPTPVDDDKTATDDESIDDTVELPTSDGGNDDEAEPDAQPEDDPREADDPDSVAVLEETGDPERQEQEVEGEAPDPTETSKSDDADDADDAETSDEASAATAVEEEKGEDEEEDQEAEDSIHHFGEDFEEDLNLGSKRWRGPLFLVGAATLLAIVLVAFIIIDDGEPTDETEIAVAEEPDEPALEEEQEPEPVEEELAQLPEDDEIAEEADEDATGLDSDEAQNVALQKGLSAEMAALDITDFLNAQPSDPEESEIEEEEPVDELAEAPQEEADPEPEPATEPEPEAPSLSDRVQQLRTLVDQERSDEALSLASELSSQAPNNQDVAYLHGRAALDSGQFPTAVEQLNRAEGLGYRRGSLYLDLATAYQLTGQTEQACQAYESFLDIEAEGSRADEVRGILDRQC